MRKRRLSKVSINTKLIIDVALASLIVQKAPGLIDSIVAIPESLKAVAGAGAGYLVGSFMKTRFGKCFDCSRSCRFYFANG